MLGFLKNIFKPKEISLSNGKEVKPPKSKAPYVIIGLVILVLISMKITDFSFETLIKRGDKFFGMLGDMIPPDTGYIAPIWTQLLDTIKMSILGSIFGCIIAIPFAILSSSNINTNKFTLNVVRFFSSIIRTIPTLIIAIIATFIFDVGTFAGTVAITIFTFGIVAKMLYEKIETVDMGPFEAMEAVGATKLQAFIGAVLPQILPTYLSTCLYSFEINVRYAAILGYVGAGGIGIILNEKIGWREYPRVGMILIMLFITVISIEYLSKFIRERLS
ncbi:MAG: phosphonate ABC transporter, permease protein PhnE [Romboutsia sp.]|uniref:phosphonate ABC transporter, permease protein PhnE n=1 Tax=Romboutsia sp. TaxID=1965302 RepID=UPI003F360E26